MDTSSSLRAPSEPSHDLECLLLSPTDPLTGGLRSGPLRRLRHPPPGVKYTLATDRFRYPARAANYEFNPVNVALVAARFALEHLAPLDQKGKALVHSFFWDVRKFERRWVHESDQSFGQFLSGYNNVKGFVRRSTTEGFSSYLNSRWCAGVVTWSDWARKGFVEDGVDHSKVFVIPPPFETVDAKKEHRGCNVLYIGRDFRRKGGDAALRAFRSLKEDGTRLVFVGPVGTPAARLEVKSDRRIAQIDGSSGKSLTECVWPTTDVLLLPTRADAFAITVVDAMRRGIPVVSTKIPAVAEAVQDGVSGLLSEVGDEEGLRENLKKLVEDPELRRRLGEGGRRRAMELFSPEKVGRSLMKVYGLAR
ncbi:MAG: glycosyltransferase family 4 protein [Nitrososphaerota archaeon]|nr:glycosyltransferase family 4 protein [Nitrososphaerota archaeon]